MGCAKLPIVPPTIFATNVPTVNAAALTVLPADGCSVPSTKSLNLPVSDASLKNAAYFVPELVYSPKKPISRASATLLAANLISESSVTIVETSCVILLPVITRSPVIARLPLIVCPPGCE